MDLQKVTNKIDSIFNWKKTVQNEMLKRWIAYVK